MSATHFVKFITQQYSEQYFLDKYKGLLMSDSLYITLSTSAMGRFAKKNILFNEMFTEWDHPRG